MITSKHIYIVVVSYATVLAASDVVYAQKAVSAKAKTNADSIVWHDCKEIGVEGKGWTDTLSFYDRLPAKAQGRVPANVWKLGHDSAGLSIRFMTDAPTIRIRWTIGNPELGRPHMPATGVSGVDLYAKNKAGQWRFVGVGEPTAVSSTASFTPPPSQEYRIHLPLINSIRSIEIGIPKANSLSAPDGQRTCLAGRLRQDEG